MQVIELLKDMKHMLFLNLLISMLQGMTAQYLVDDTVRLRPNDTVLGSMAQCCTEGVHPKVLR